MLELTLPRVEEPKTSPEGPTTVPGANPNSPIQRLASDFYKFLTMSTICHVIFGEINAAIERCTRDCKRVLDCHIQFRRA